MSDYKEIFECLEFMRGQLWNWVYYSCSPPSKRETDEFYARQEKVNAMIRAEPQLLDALLATEVLPSIEEERETAQKLFDRELPPMVDHYPIMQLLSPQWVNRYLYKIFDGRIPHRQLSSPWPLQNHVRMYRLKISPAREQKSYHYDFGNYYSISPTQYWVEGVGYLGGGTIMTVLDMRVSPEENLERSTALRRDLKEKKLEYITMLGRWTEGENSQEGLLFFIMLPPKETMSAAQFRKEIALLMEKHGQRSVIYIPPRRLENPFFYADFGRFGRDTLGLLRDRDPLEVCGHIPSFNESNALWYSQMKRRKYSFELLGFRVCSRWMEAMNAGSAGETAMGWS